MCRLRYTLALLLLATIAPTAYAQSNWKFPSRYAPSRFNKKLRVVVFNLGGGYYAHGSEFEGSPVVIVTFPRFAPNVPETEAAFIVALKVLRMPANLKDAFPDESHAGVYRFFTATGDVAYVALSKRRDSATVRVIASGIGARQGKISVSLD
jgi:hypothetical protein